VWHLDYSQRGGFAVYLSGTIRDRSGGLAMGAQRSRSRWLAFASVVAALTVAVAGSDQAQARAKSKRDARPRAIHGPSYHPPYAAIVIDDKSGAVLHEVSADEPRHPASLTKIMTLYLLFEELEAGTLKLDTLLPVSTRASVQNPTKLGLKPNQTIKVEEAILGLVTKSANDAAVVIAEAIAGSVEEFAERMTRKARALGMSGTTYVNASGLPAEEQITTARDQALLGRAIQHRFPVYYQYFSTPSFRYKGAEMRNHNHLLGNVKGVDGIKTGYTEASGYNLTSSVRRDDKHIVAVVLGGTSNAARDARMRQLIEEHIVRAALVRTAPLIAEINDGAEQESRPVLAIAPAASKPASATGEGDAGAAEAKAEAVPLPRPRVLAATGGANGSKQAANTKAPTRATRLTAKPAASSTPQAAYTLSQSQTRNLDRKAGSFSY
jgi:D-alanyl-D-alanine carboxypeptidase